MIQTFVERIFEIACNPRSYFSSNSLIYGEDTAFVTTQTYTQLISAFLPALDERNDCKLDVAYRLWSGVRNISIDPAIKKILDRLTNENPENNLALLQLLHTQPLTRKLYKLPSNQESQIAPPELEPILISYLKHSNADVKI